MKTCPTCQQTYPDDVDSCPLDGARLDTEAREERECPYCAEMILKKARVCKHCGREVEPLAASGTSIQTLPTAPPQGTPETRTPQPQTSKPAGAAGSPPAASKTPWLRTKPEPSSRVKYIAIIGAVLIPVGAGVWYLSHHRAKTVGIVTQATTSTPTLAAPETGTDPVRPEDRAKILAMLTGGGGGKTANDMKKLIRAKQILSEKIQANEKALSDMAENDPNRQAVTKELGIQRQHLRDVSVTIDNGMEGLADLAKTDDAEISALAKEALSALKEQVTYGQPIDYAELYAKAYGTGLPIGKRYQVEARVNPDLTLLYPLNGSSPDIGIDHRFFDPNQLEKVMRMLAGRNDLMTCTVVVSEGRDDEGNGRLFIVRAENCH